MALTGGFIPSIRKRGLFSQDSFFQDVQKDFNVAIDDVMDRWGGRSLLADQFSSYRNLRKEQPKNDTIAASISDTKDSYVIVIDLSAYINGEITVKTAERNAVVEAKYGANHYLRKFPLPLNTNTEGVVAAMSDDGIMTITAPKITKGKAASENKVSEQPASSNDRKSSFVSSLKIDVDKALAQSSDRKFSHSQGQRIIPLIVEDGTQIQIAEEKENSQAQAVEQSKSTAAASQVTKSKTTQSSTTSFEDRILPIMKRGHFFKDSFFENVWGDFETAMSDMVINQKSQNTAAAQNVSMTKSSAVETEVKAEQCASSNLSSSKQESSSIEDSGLLNVGRRFDRMNSYKNLRNWALTEDNQAVTVTKEPTFYKIVLDVQNFQDGKLDVKAVEETVEILGEKGDLSFKRTFNLPGMKKPEEVTADLSTDGVLTVTAPL